MTMKHLFVTAVMLAISGCASSPAPAPADPLSVRVDSGSLHGVLEGDTVAFKGVPYAAPPVGDLRWRPTQPATRWAGVRDASKYGAICPQKPSATDNGVGKQPQSEDCLTLNLWTQAQPASARRPVMVWIHGGGFVNGSGTADLYNGSALARRGVVVVTINYRLGRLGSFAHPLLTKESNGGATANYGLMDMVASLQWVKRNVAAFGGDPGNVTIFGESAGGMAVNRLMISPAARGLFAKAIVQSGAGRERVVTLAAAETQGEGLAKSLGVDAKTAAELRAIPADKIISAGDPSTFEGGGPVLEPHTFPMPVAQAFAKGQEAKVPYLLGFNSAEFPATPATLDDSLKRILGLTPADHAELAKLYPDADNLAEFVVGDLVFSEPARHLAALHAGNGHTTYLYRFDVVSKSVQNRMKGTRHAQERQYVFDTLPTSPYPTDANDAAQAQFANAYWAAFAKTGDPNGAGRPVWPAYTSAKDQLLDFTNSGPVAKPAPTPERWAALAARYPK